MLSSEYESRSFQSPSFQELHILRATLWPPSYAGLFLCILYVYMHFLHKQLWLISEFASCAHLPFLHLQLSPSASTSGAFNFSIILWKINQLAHFFYTSFTFISLLNLQWETKYEDFFVRIWSNCYKVIRRLRVKDSSILRSQYQMRSSIL